MTKEKIDNLTTVTIMEDDTFLSLYSIPDEIERAKMTVFLKQRAKALGLKKDFTDLLDMWEKRVKEVDAQYKKEQAMLNAVVPLKFTDKGVPAVSIENFTSVLNNDPYLNDKFLWNELSNRPEHLFNGTIQPWKDEDDSRLRSYIESKYHIHSIPKLDDALRIKFSENKYHPVKDIIENIDWDGQNRIETLLIKYLGVEDSEYSKEVSRLIFAGGINRIFKPGCKFDDMPVLIGQKQGEGKSTFVRWLAMEDKFYREVTEIDGQRGIESIEGAWICEMGELLALKRTKDVEAVKSYITRLCDTYRKPFDKRTSDQPRQCIFIGTTNTTEFLTDKTGNRRYYPVTCYNSGRELFAREAEVKADIAQCWAEAYHRFLNGDMQPVANRQLMQVIKERQNEACEDDYRVGMIDAYIADKDKVCVLELWREALGESFNPTKRDSSEINLIMQAKDGWVKSKSTARCGDYGIQRAWVREQIKPESIEDLPF